MKPTLAESQDSFPAKAITRGRGTAKKPPVIALVQRDGMCAINAPVERVDLAHAAESSPRQCSHRLI